MIRIILFFSADIQAHDPSWYSALTAHLSPDQQNDMQEIAKMADQRNAAAGKQDFICLADLAGNQSQTICNR